MADKLPSAEINRRLQELRERAGALLVEFPEESDFAPRFADLADEVRDAAGDDHIEEASIRITDILVDLGVVPEHERQH